jgi:hypothetical protein
MHHPTMGRRAPQTGLAPAVTIAIASLAVSAVFALGCSPYPIYNPSGPGARPQKETVERQRPGADQEASVTHQELEFVDAEDAVVEPGYFTHIVEGYLGAPYKLGGDDVDGIDCSNLVRVIYRDYDGTRLPSSTKKLYRLHSSIAPDELAVGDLVFFDFNNSGVSHVGVYLGNARFVHASQSRGVIISSLKDPAYRDRYVGARRAL